MRELTRRAARHQTVESLRNDAIEVMSNALNTYGEGAAAASVDMFDTVMELEGLTVRGTIRSGIITQAEVDRIAHYQATKLLRDDVDGFIEQMANSTAFMTRQVANGTTMAQSAYMQYRGGWEFRQNLRGGKGRAVWSYSEKPYDGYQIRYARVPQGLETCDFCLMLASRGFVYLTAESAEGWNHTHRGCDCIVVAGVVHKEHGALVQDTVLEGYEPETLSKVYQSWDGLDDSEAKLDALESVTGRREW